MASEIASMISSQVPGEQRIEFLGVVDEKIRFEVSWVLVHFFPEVLYLRVKRQADPHSAHYEGRGGIRAVTFHPDFLREDVIAHEITHFVQDKRNHDDGWVLGERPPNGEKSCDVYVCARHKELARIHSSYLDIDYKGLERAYSEFGARELLCVKAREALALRARGERRYIRYMEQAVNLEIKNSLARIGGHDGQ